MLAGPDYCMYCWSFLVAIELLISGQVLERGFEISRKTWKEMMRILQRN